MKYSTMFYRLSYSLSAVFAVAILILPLFSVLIIKFNKNELESKMFETRYSTLTEGLNKEKASVYHSLSIMLLRRLIYAIVVIFLEFKQGL